VLRIGSVADEDDQLLHMVTDSRLLANGTIAVVNSGSQEVRFFGMEGELLATIGGRGEGPGEFMGPWVVFPGASDSTFVVDLYRAISVFDADLTYVRRFTPSVPEEFETTHGYEPVDQFGDGTFLLRAHYPQASDVRGIGRNTIRMVRGYHNGSVESLGDFLDQTVSYDSEQEYAFGPWAKEAASASTMWYGPGDVLEFREIGFDGELRSLVRLNRPSRPVTEGDLDAYVAAQLERFRGLPSEPFLRRRVENAIHPEFFPPHSEMETDDLGNLWVQDYRAWGSEDHIDRFWTVFDAEGRYLGDVTVPAGVTVHNVHDRHLIGSWRNELGVEFVHLYSIDKPE